MRVFVCQIGARRHYAVPVALHRAGMLEVLATDWCANRGIAGWVARHIQPEWRRGPLRRMGDRLIPEIPSQAIRNRSNRSLRAGWRRWRDKSSEENYQRWIRENREFGERVAADGFGAADAVYGFNAAALEVFEAAKSQGLQTILDQTMAPWDYVEPLLAEERLRWPGWEAELPNAHWRALANRERREWELADVILCGSAFVVDALAQVGGPAEKCRVVSYGYSSSVTPQNFSQREPAGKLRVLFVGTVDLRKGVPYLLQAAKIVGTGNAEFRIVGPIGVTDEAVQELAERTTLIGRVPRSQVREHYAWADLFVLPTLAEGSANVCYEAMAHRLPVLTTDNAGSVVRDGVDGWIVPARSAEAIAECIVRAARDRGQLFESGISAHERVQQFSWDDYECVLAQTIRESFSPRSVDVAALVR